MESGVELRLNVNDDRSERVRYNCADFPMYTSKCSFASFSSFIFTAHWHDDVEFICVTNGEMNYNVNGHIVNLKKGDGIFVNSRQLHFGYSMSSSDCEYICILFHPMLLCATPFIEKKYITSVITNTDFEYFLFSDKDEEGRRLTQYLTDVHFTKQSRSYYLNIQSLFYSIWAVLYDQLPEEETHKHENSHLSALKNMAGYIQKNYTEKITLDDIALSGNVCKSSCCAVFRKYVNKTPVEYLTDYRISKAVALLEETEMTVTEIAMAVGFGGSSYFTEIFTRKYGSSPTKFRNHIRK
ncbi:MAG: AraC family transcriptional regulator [Oscillospiraceae bacterium]|nr:AraC family transcriptional regulator [Oscillospiraceae bacterium]